MRTVFASVAPPRSHGLGGAPAAMSTLRDCAKSLLPDSKTSCGSSLRCPHTASALVQEVFLKKDILLITFTNRLRLDRFLRR